MILVRVHEADSVVTHRVEVFPALIGRAMHCSVRIDEPGVSAHHAELHTTGEGFELRDLASTNGLYRGERPIDSLALTAFDTVYLGNVRVDIITEDTPEKTQAKRTLPNYTAYGPGSPLKIGLAMVSAYLGTCAIAASDQYQVFWPPQRPVELFSKGFILWAALLMVTLLVSLFSKLNAKHFYFYQVLLLIVAATIAAKACMVLSPTLAFNLHQLPFAGYIRHFGLGLTAFWVVYLLQRYVFPRLSVSQRAAIALAAAAITISATQVWLDRNRVGERETMAPIGLDLRPAIGVKPNADDLFFDLALSVTAADRQRIKVLEELEDERDN